MIYSNFITQTAYLLTTDLIVTLIFTILFPLALVGLGIKFMKNPEK